MRIQYVVILAFTDFALQRYKSIFDKTQARRGAKGVGLVDSVATDHRRPKTMKSVAGVAAPDMASAVAPLFWTGK